MDKKLLAQVIGGVFILIGIVGFVNDPVIGLFDVDTIHNLVHIISGALAFVLVRNGERGAVNYGKIMTVVYGLVTVLGFVATGSDNKLLGIMANNTADNVLHLLLTAVFVYLGFVGMKGARGTKAETA